MDWSQVLYSGIGGGAGAALGSFLAIGVNKVFIKKEGLHYITVAAFTAGLAVLGMSIAPDMYRNMKLPRIVNNVEQEILSSSPVYLALKEHEPDYYNRVVEQIDSGIRNGKGVEELINLGRSILTEVLAEKSQYADEDTLTNLMEITKQSFEDYKVTKPELCTRLLNQRSLGDIGAYTSGTVKKLEENYTIKVIKLSRENVIASNSDMARETLKKMELQMQTFLKLGEAIDLADDATAKQHTRVCEVGKKSMELILELPDGERANYIRSALGQ